MDLLIWPKTGNGDGVCKYGNALSASTKFGEFLDRLKKPLRFSGRILCRGISFIH